MSSIKDLKKEVNIVFSELIEAVYLADALQSKDSSEKVDVLLDEIIATFDQVIVKINTKQGANKQYFRSVRKELQQSVDQIVVKINSL